MSSRQITKRNIQIYDKWATNLTFLSNRLSDNRDTSVPPLNRLVFTSRLIINEYSLDIFYVEGQEQFNSFPAR